MAIGYAGAVATLWTCIIPALLAWKVRAGKGEQGGKGDGFRAPGGLPMIVGVLLFGGFDPIDPDTFSRLGL
ncbi:low affinity tryptophan permease [Aeromonas encheleia]|nr:low affinity tryptophan permease [Aeromonas encheleia]